MVARTGFPELLICRKRFPFLLREEKDANNSIVLYFYAKPIEYSMA